MARKPPPNPEAWARVAAAVQDARTRRGWSQQSLASHSGVSLATVSLLERAGRDNYQAAKVGAIWRALGLPSDELHRLLNGAAAPAEDDPRIEALRADVENAPLSDRVRQTILTLIDAELRNKV